MVPAVPQGGIQYGPFLHLQEYWYRAPSSPQMEESALPFPGMFPFPASRHLVSSLHRNLLLLRPQEDDRQHNHPQQIPVDIDALDNPEPRWGKGIVPRGSQPERGNTSGEKGQDCPDGVETEPVLVRHRSESHGQQHEGHLDTREDGVQGIGRRTRGLPQVHREWCPCQADESDQYQQASRDAQEAVLTGRSPDAPSKCKDQHSVEEEQRNDERSRGSADRGLLADGLMEEAVAWEQGAGEDVRTGIQQGRENPA